MSRAREFADLAGSADAGGLTGRNLIINGAMQVAQRGTSFATMGDGDSQYTLDRFKWQESGSPTLEMTVTQDSSSPNEMGNSKSLKVEVTTAQSSLGSGDRVRIEQYIEAQNCQSIAKGTSAAKSLSASFWVKSSKTGTYIVELQENDNDRINSQSYSISSANTWEHKTLTFPADTTGAINNDTGNGISFRMYLCAGTDYTSGSLNTSWVGVSGNNTGAAVGQVNLADTVNATWYITGVQLEVGEKATPFEHRSFADELRRCQRYFYFLNLGGTYQVGGGLPGMLYSSGLAFATIPFMCEMRAAPSITPSNANTWQFINASDSPHQCQTVAGYASSKYSASITLDPSSATDTPVVANTGGGILWPGNANSNDATVSLAAEL